MRIFAGNSNPELNNRLCKELKIKRGNITVDKFADGESRVVINENVRNENVYILQSTSAPVNEHLMELLIMIDAFRRSSAKSITAVIPYFGYARQDRKDQPRVPITAKLVADLLTNAGATRVITMDLHADQIQGFFNVPVDNLYGSLVYLDELRKKKLKNLVVVSTDVGGIKIARATAKKLGADLAIADKRRTGVDKAEVMHLIGEVEGKNAIMPDDLVSTGTTLVQAAAALRKNGAKKIFAACTHPILSAGAVEKIEASPIDQLIVTDSIPLSERAAQSKRIKQVSVAPLLAEVLRRIESSRSISSLFE
jgi:ribose-phosphate pyrophosphokinase